MFLGEEIQQKIEYLWFEIGLKKSEIFDIISRDRHIEQEDISNHIANFKAPELTEAKLIELLFKDIEASADKYPKIKASNRYLKFDSQNCIIAFSFCTKQIKNRYADLIMIDIKTAEKHCKESGYNIIFILGIDIFGDQIILFTAITQSKDVNALAQVLDYYLEAGFMTPKHVILDNLEFSRVITERFNLSDKEGSN